MPIITIPELSKTIENLNLGGVKSSQVKIDQLSQSQNSSSELTSSQPPSPAVNNSQVELRQTLSQTFRITPILRQRIEAYRDSVENDGISFSLQRQLTILLEKFLSSKGF